MKISIFLSLYLFLLSACTVNLFAGSGLSSDDFSALPIRPVAQEPCCQKLLSFTSVDGNSFADFVIKGTANFFYGDHVNFFSASPLDQVFYAGSNWDLIFDSNLNEAVQARIMLRTDGKWGNATEPIITTLSDFKIGDAVTGDHRHAIPRLVPWIREAWCDFSVNKALSLNDAVQHRVRIGAFPFSLGRGISLGSAYAASSGFLGFCSSNIIDQFAFGTLLYADIIKNQLTYNAYVGFLDNYSDSFGRVNQIVNENRVGSRDNPERGFGIIDFVFAFDLKWRPLNHPAWNGNFEIEPYLMYNHAPQQLVNVFGNAKCRLGTLGICMEYVGSRWEWGFDTAMNFGSQYVYALDRNRVQIFVDTDGTVKNQYTQIVNSNSDLAIETAGLKRLVNTSGQGVTLNNIPIGYVVENVCCTPIPVEYFNTETRFRPDYTNALKGAMLVMDGAWSVRENKTLKIVVTAAWASGDVNPNQDVAFPHQNQFNNDYTGFIGLQEIYSGKRIESLFLIGNNSIVRPLSTPTFVSDPSDIAGIVAPDKVGFGGVVGGFTNIAFIGGGFDYKTSVMRKKWRIRPSVLSYWQDFATRAYDVTAQIPIESPANKHLGVEINTTIKVDLVGEISGYFIGGIFVPGKHYIDVFGTPLDNLQLEDLNKSNSSGYPPVGVPILGTSTAIALNWGLDICF